MAMFVWAGGQTGVETSAQDGQNWRNEAGVAYAQARYPGSDAGIEDDVYFDAACSYGATGTCDFSAKEVLRSMHVGPLYNKDLGASAGWWKCECREVVFDGTACPHAYLNGTGTDGLNKIVVSDGADIKFDGKLTDPVFLKGTIDCAASMVITGSLIVAYATSPTTDVLLTLNSGMTLPANIQITGGIIVNYNPITTLVNTAAEWTQAAGDITTIECYGGMIYWNAGNTATIYVYGGICDASGDATARRLGNAYVYQQGTLNLDNGQDNILVTGKVRNLGGTITLPSGYELAPYPNDTFAGASDVKYGVAPQEMVSIADANGEAIYIGLQDRLVVYCEVGALATTAAVHFHIEESATETPGSWSEVTGKVVTFADTDDDKTKQIVLWGHELTSGKPWARIKVENTVAVSAFVAAAYVRSTF